MNMYSCVCVCVYTGYTCVEFVCVCIREYSCKYVNIHAHTWRPVKTAQGKQQQYVCVVYTFACVTLVYVNIRA